MKIQNKAWYSVLYDKPAKKEEDSDCLVKLFLMLIRITMGRLVSITWLARWDFLIQYREVRKQFASPLKDMNEQTILIENSEENKNDSYRQRTKYDDQEDSYFSTYDLSALLGNWASYLEGKLSSADDVDYFAFSYKQRVFYEKMGVSSKITIRLENMTEGCDYDLIVYDKDGNQIGIAKKNSDGSRELTLQEGFKISCILKLWIG